MKKISALAAVLLIATVIGGPAALAQTTGTPNSGAGVQGCRETSRAQLQSRSKTRVVNPAASARIKAKFPDCAETNRGRHQKKRPSSNSCGRHFGGLLFLRFPLVVTRPGGARFLAREPNGLYLPQEKRIDGAKFSSRCRPPITAAPHAAAAPAANAAAKVNAIITALSRAFAAASRDSERTCATRRSASAAGSPVRADTSCTRWS
jgi:hypothetical protein